MVTDGVFASASDGQAQFFEATELTPDVIHSVQSRLRRRVLRYLERHGCLEPDTVEDMLSWEHEGGFSLDASVRIEGWDRNALERLARYCARPPFSSGRLGQLDEQNLVYSLPRPTPDGSSALVMDPLQLLTRLAALIPPPRTHLVRYFGVLAPSAALREQVISSAGPSAALMEQISNAAELMGLQYDSDPGASVYSGVAVDAGPRTDTDKPVAGSTSPASPPGPKPDEEAGKTKRRASYLWAMLIARIYSALPLQCPRCGQPMRIIAFIIEPSTVSRLLGHLGEPTKPPPLSPARGPPQAHQDELEFLGQETTWV